MMWVGSLLLRKLYYVVNIVSMHSLPSLGALRGCIKSLRDV